MTSRHLALACTMTLLATGGISLSTTAAAAPRHCARPKGATDLKSNRSVVVYSRSGAGAKYPKEWWACRRSSGKRTLLLGGGLLEDGEYIARQFRLAGSYVVFEEDYNREEEYDFDLRRFDTKARRFVTIPLAHDVGRDFPGTRVRYSLRGLRLNNRGVVAWDITAYNADAKAELDSVGVRDRDGIRTLDIEPTGTTSGLTLGSSSVTWIVNGTSKSASVRS